MKSRLRSDQGAVAVMVALMMIPLLVCAALVVDVGALYLRRAQLQNAADAAALAVAQDCASGRQPCTVAASTPTAKSLADSNAPGVQPVSVALNPNGNPTSVRATTSSRVDFLFAPVIGPGNDNKELGAASTAGWPPITGGVSTLPLTFSLCAFTAQTGGSAPPTGNTMITILLPKTDNTGCSKGNGAPGAFGWLDTGGKVCSVSTNISSNPLPDPGRSISNGCKKNNALVQIQNTTLILPIYDVVDKKAGYHIVAYAAFVLKGYSFTGQDKWNAPCSGNDSCISGYFTKWVSPSEAYSHGSGALDLGARVVILTA